MEFASDNTAGLHPAVLAALAAEATRGPQPAYGADAATDRLTEVLTALFERPVTVLPVPTGTAANSIALAAATPPWGAIYAHAEAHIAVDECGAPEFFTGGAKLVALTGPGAKITAGSLAEILADTLDRGVHSVQPAAVSLTQSSERGCVYRPDEVRAVADVAHAHGLKVHMDGARFANALASLGCTPADVTWRAGVDILSFGGTKNGAAMAEAIVCFDPALADTLAARRKRGGHLLSKMRFVSVQMLALLEAGLWLQLAATANARARALGAALSALPRVSLADPVEANAVFAWVPQDAAEAALAQGAHFYPWEARAVSGRRLYRFVCSFATTEADIAALVGVLGGALAGTGR